MNKLEEEKERKEFCTFKPNAKPAKAQLKKSQMKKSEPPKKGDKTKSGRRKREVLSPKRQRQIQLDTFSSVHKTRESVGKMRESTGGRSKPSLKDCLKPLENQRSKKIAIAAYTYGKPASTTLSPSTSTNVSKTIIS